MHNCTSIVECIMRQSSVFLSFPSFLLTWVQARHCLWALWHLSLSYQSAGCLLFSYSSLINKGIAVILTSRCKTDMCVLLQWQWGSVWSRQAIHLLVSVQWNALAAWLYGVTDSGQGHQMYQRPASHIVRSPLSPLEYESVPKIITNNTIMLPLLNCSQHFGNFKP